MKQFVILGIILFFVVAGFHPVNIWGDSASLQEKIKAEKERRLKFYKSLSEYDRALLGVNIVGDNLEKPSNNGTLLYGEDGGIPREVLEESGISYKGNNSSGIPREVLEESGFPRYKKPEKSYGHKKSVGIPQDVLNESGFPSYKKPEENYSYKESSGIPQDVLDESFGAGDEVIVEETISPEIDLELVERERRREKIRKAKALLAEGLMREAAEKRVAMEKKKSKALKAKSKKKLRTDNHQDKSPDIATRLQERLKKADAKEREREVREMEAEAVRKKEEMIALKEEARKIKVVAEIKEAKALKEQNVVKSKVDEKVVDVEEVEWANVAADQSESVMSVHDDLKKPKKVFEKGSGDFNEKVALFLKKEAEVEKKLQEEEIPEEEIAFVKILPGFTKNFPLISLVAVSVIITVIILYIPILGLAAFPALVVLSLFFSRHLVNTHNLWEVSVLSLVILEFVVGFYIVWINDRKPINSNGEKSFGTLNVDHFDSLMGKSLEDE
jgi:hypothetical protein